MSTPKPAASENTAEHVHGPDCQHDHHGDHDHDHHHHSVAPYRREMPKLGRNDPCYCGSGKKFKKCHGLVNE
ncbi:MAG TPA: SEC-C metal-binding domain-containing protein [Steroidobacteraceae bacterium]|nr:SEC-C metal-binding domain-containing protein [Steroidobacteraceae bacterium]